MSPSPEECGREVLDVVPLVMRTIRAEMRHHRTPELSVPQFRVLTFLNRHEGASLSDVADHIGLTLPSMSKIVDGLVARNLVTRQTHPGDRRRVKLALTTEGQAALHSARELTQASLAERLAVLSPSERTTIVQAMLALRSIFDSGREAKTDIVR